MGAENGRERKRNGVFAELMELERRIEAEVAVAEAEAARMVESARHEARSRERESESSLSDRLRSLRASIERERKASVRAIAAQAAAEGARYTQVDEATVARMAEWVASRLVTAASNR